MPSKQMTAKFDGATTCPDKVGVFHIEAEDLGPHTWYSYWNGKSWGYRVMVPDMAWRYRLKGALGPVTRWWGFVEKQE